MCQIMVSYIKSWCHTGLPVDMVQGLVASQQALLVYRSSGLQIKMKIRLLIRWAGVGGGGTAVVRRRGDEWECQRAVLVGMHRMAIKILTKIAWIDKQHL